MSSETIVVRVPKELKKRMKNVKINWSEEIRTFIEKRLKSYELYQTLKDVRRRAEKRKVSVDSTKLIREERDSR